MKDPGICNQPGEADGRVVLDIDVEGDMHWHYVGHSAGYVTHRSRRRYISSVPALHMDIRGLTVISFALRPRTEVGEH